MKRTTFLILTLMMFSSLLFGQWKKKYDIIEKSGNGDQLLKTGPGRDGEIFRSAIFEYSLLEDGYFTIGTNQGATEGMLDDNCQLTYGHPYSLTSFIKIYEAGQWKTPFYNFRFYEQEISVDDSVLSINLTEEDNLAINFRIYPSGQENNLILELNLQNLSSGIKEMGTGLALDISLGENGDGFLKYNDTEITDETYLDEISNSDIFRITERNTDYKGLIEEISFPESAPASVNVTNWRRLAEDEIIFETQFVQIFDLALDIRGEITELQPGESVNMIMSITLPQPDFPESIFARADIPPELSIEEGILVPEIISAYTKLINNSNSNIYSLSSTISFSEYFEPVITSVSVPVAPGDFSIVEIPVATREFFKEKLLELTLEVKDGSVVIDKIERLLYIPAVPLSDSGLVVNIDSVITDNYPEISVRFNALKESSGGYIFDLDPENIFFTENDEIIEDFTVGKDTSGGNSDIDIIFILDVTGSMSDEIAAVKNNIIEFTDSLTQQGINYRLGMVTFLDEVENIYDFTSDPLIFKSYVEQQYAHGGGEYEENSLEALMTSTQFNFRPSARRMNIWITDAAYHINNSFTSLTVEEVVDALLSFGIQTHCIGNTAEQTNFYNPIVIPTGGDFYDINGNFRDILLNISGSQYLSDYLITYTSSLPAGSINNIGVEVHYAGLGGKSVYNMGMIEKPVVKENINVSCYPNPFNPTANIRVVKPTESGGKVVIYNILGQQIKTFNLAAGESSFLFKWNGRSDAGMEVGSGVYIVNTLLTDFRGGLMEANSQKIMYLK